MHYFKGLDERDFVIGHRILSLVLGKDGYDLEKFSAFHANYTLGVSMKARNLGFALLKNRQIATRFWAALTLVFEKLTQYARMRFGKS